MLVLVQVLVPVEVLVVEGSIFQELGVAAPRRMMMEDSLLRSHCRVLISENETKVLLK